MSALTPIGRPRMRRRTGSALDPVSVLLLHGMGGGAGTWDALASQLAPHLELWDVNLPWSVTGDPAWARDPDATQWGSAVLANFRMSAGCGPDVVVAHSFAANLVLELAAGSDLLASTPIVLLSPFCRGTRADLDWQAVIPSMKDCFARVYSEIRPGRDSLRSAELRETVVRRTFELMGAFPPLRFYEVYLRTSKLRFESLSMPLLVVGGADDVDAATESVHVLGQKLPDAHLKIMDDCGHFPMMERAPELARLIEDFVDRAVRGRRSRPVSESP